MVVLAWLGATLAVACVVLYYAYAWGGAGGLEPWMRSPRRAALALALVLAAPAIFTRGGPYGGAGHAGWPVVIVVGSVGWAWARQWLALGSARALRPLSREGEQGLARAALVVVLPGGDAALLAGLARRRVARVGGAVLARCALARSLALFRTELALRPSLPLVAGFEVAAGPRRFDALDGRARDGGPDLEHAPLALCTLEAWRERFPAATLYAAAALPAGGAEGEVTARTAAARGVANPGELGVVRDGRWEPLAPGALASCPPWAGAARGDGLYVARWAAVARGWA